MGRVEGKVALISGAARGMGAMDARLLAREGAKVVIGDVLAEEGEALAQEIRAAGGAAIFLPLDVTVENDWVKAVEAAERSYGRLDVLVNNAGIAPQDGPLHELSLEKWNRVIAINQTGTFLGMKHAIAPLRRAGGGSIINMSSTAALVGFAGIAAYTASKAAVRLLTKHAAIEYAKENIRVNSIHPGLIATPMNANSTPERMRLMEQKIPMGRRGQPEEVAYCVLYLASNESTFTTGAEFVIDGGTTAQ